jgi:DNA helicase-2/ATP-dependent DNA helicase PcrA
VPPDAETGETLSPLAAFLTHAALESGDNQAQAGQDAVQLMTVHAAKGLEFDACSSPAWKRACSRSERSMSDYERAGGRAAPDVRGDHARAQAPVPEPFADAHAARPDPLQRQEPLLRGTARGALKWLTPKNQNFGGSAFGYGTFASPPVPPQKTAPSHGLRSGMQVFHNKFGEGTVLALEGTGDDARAQVKFTRHGVKWLALSVAKLTPV